MTEGLGIIGSDQAAAILGVSVRTVQRKADTGSIPVLSTGIGKRREYLFDADVIEGLKGTDL